MKCINRFHKTICIICVSLIFMTSMTGCGAKEFTFAYDRNRNNTSFSTASHTQGKTMEAFASGLCVTAGDVTAGTDVDMSK